MRKTACCLALVALGGCVAAPDGEPLARSEAAIAGGVLDSQHSEVFELITHWGGGLVTTCTATLIAPNLMITARHCLAASDGEHVVCGEAPFEDPVSPDSVIVTNATTPTQGSRYFRGASISVPAEGRDTCGFDLALVTLTESVPASLSVPAIPRLDHRPEPGEIYVALGYGQDDLGNATAGRMRLEGLEVMCLASACGGLGVAEGEFLGEEGVCSGDSGGPALDAQGRVLGALSRGSDPCGTPVYGSTAAFPDWLRQTALDAAELGGYEAPLWARTGSSDQPPGAEGESCWPGGTCQAGSACYYARNPSDAVCTRVCSSSGDCSGRATCVDGFDVPEGGLCLTPASQVDEQPEDAPGDSGCSFGAGSSDTGGKAGSLASALALAALVLARRRR